MMADVKDGQDSHAGVYDDRMTKEDGDELSFAVTDESNLNNYTQEGLYPGASGVLSFTVTPYADNLHDITISLSRVIATKNNVDGDAALGLFKGHLLFFEQKTGDYYSGRVKDDAFTIKKERFYKGETTKTEKPVHITLYWVWPEYFQNYVLTGSTGYYKNLFASTDDTDYSSLQENMNKYPERYFEGTVGGETKVKVGSEMSSSAMTIGSALFNNADEKLGNEVDYLKINLKAKEAAQEGTTSGSN